MRGKPPLRTATLSQGCDLASHPVKFAPLVMLANDPSPAVWIVTKQISCKSSGVFLRSLMMYKGATSKYIIVVIQRADIV